MRQDLIFGPMGALALLTFAALFLVGFRRVGASRRGVVRPKDFRFGESANVPGEVSIPNRNYMNLLEMPTLFYVSGLMFYVTHRVSVLVLALSWTYVALRCVHSAIHLTYNNVLHRLIAFVVGNFVLMALWLVFFVSA